MKTQGPAVEQIVDLAQRHARTEWSSTRVESVLREVELKLALEGSDPLRNSTSQHRALWIGAFAIFLAATLAGSLAAHAKLARDDDDASRPGANLEDRSVVEALDRITLCRRLLESGDAASALEHLSRNPETGDEIFAHERTELTARARCMLAAQRSPAPSGSANDCSRLARERLLSRGG